MPNPSEAIARMARAGAALLLGIVPSACVAPLAPPVSVAGAPSFSPERFFAGRTEGQGTIAIVARRRHGVHVLGTGEVAPDGTLTLSQTVTEDGKPSRQRQWRIRQVSPGHFVGTLSDATGPIVGDVDGNRLRLRFRMAGGLAAEQRLDLQPDGRTVSNVLMVRKLGIVVAVLNETIRKVE